MQTFVCACFFCFILQAAKVLEERCWDVEIVYISDFNCKRSAKLFREDFHLVQSDETGCFHNICDLMRDQVLAGYHVIAGVNPLHSYSPVMLDENVREALCDCRPFYSEDLRRCFDKIEDILQDSIVQHRPECHALRACDVHSTIYPNKRTRQWFLTMKESDDLARWKHGVHIVFKGDDRMLLGLICSIKEGQCTRSTGSLLQIKRLLEEPRPSCLRPVGAFLSPPCFDDFVKYGMFASGHGVGVAYFPEDGAPPRSALFDVDGFYVNARYPDQRGVQEKKFLDLFSYMCGEILCGCFFMKSGIKAVKDMRMFLPPDVRDMVSDWRPFSSVLLRTYLLTTFSDLLRMQHKVLTGRGWGGLTADHLSHLYRLGKNVLWMPVKAKTLLGVLEVERPRALFAGSVIVVFQEETMALHGRVVEANYAEENAKYPEGSFAELLCKQIIAEAKRGPAFDGALCVAMQEKLSR